MSAHASLPDLAVFAAAIASADLADWQALAELQQQVQGLLATIPDGDAHGVLVQAGQVLDGLFSDSLTAADLAAAKEGLIGLLLFESPSASASADEDLLPDPIPDSAPRWSTMVAALSTALTAVATNQPEASAGVLQILDQLAADVHAEVPDDVMRVLDQVRATMQGAHILPTSALTQVADWLAVRCADQAPHEPERATILLGRLTAAVIPPVQLRAPPQVDPTLGQVEPLPAEASSETASEFLTEAGEYVETIERLMLAIEAAPTPENLNGIFRAFHTIKGLAGFLHLRRIQVLAHASEDLLDKLRNGAVAVDRPIVDLLLTSADQLKLLLAGLTEGLSSGQLAATPDLPSVIGNLRAAAGTGTPHLGAVLVSSGVVNQVTVDAALQTQRLLAPQRKLGEILVEAGQLTPRELTYALGQQAAPPPPPNPSAAAAPAATMRVDVARVDALNDAIGELVIAQNMVSCSPELRELGSRRVQALLAQLDRVTRTIQDMSMRLRLVSVQSTFQRMVRLGRDAAKGLGKAVDIVTEGEDQELDKSVVERLGDPLVHLVRNAIDHGLENTEARAAAGKSSNGRVVLRAFRRAGGFCVEISDDGKGLDRQRILAKARERGLVREGQVLRDDEVLNLIFLPGFSTAEVVTNMSGRGVGMDVVRRMVEEMRGQVLLTSEPGKGTTVTITLPLTLAIIDGMEIGVGGQRYIIPTLSVVTTLRPTAGMLTGVQGRGGLLTFGGRQVPVYDLHAVFELPATPVERPLLVIVEDGTRQAALVIDAIYGRHQVVVKTMSTALPPAPGIGGATISGDGRVCLVCDVAGLIQLASTSFSNAPLDALNLAMTP